MFYYSNNYLYNYPQIFFQPIFLESNNFMHETPSNSITNFATTQIKTDNSLPFARLPSEKDKKKTYQQERPKIELKEGPKSKYQDFKNLVSEQNTEVPIKLHCIIANKINLIISYIRRIRRSGKMVQKIMDKFKHQNKNQNSFGKYNIKKFYAYMHYLKENLDGFTHRSSIEAIINHYNPSLTFFNSEEQIFYNKVARILMAYYIRQISFFDVINGAKIKTTAKRDHLTVHRYLNNIIKGRKQVDIDGLKE